MVKIFDINEGIIVINETCLLMPELKTIVDTYENPIPVLCYVHYMADPKSVYRHLPQEEMEELILKDYPGDYTVDDEPVYKAIEKIKRLYQSPTMRLLEDAKIGLKKLGDYLRLTEVTADKDGSGVNYRQTLASIAKISREFRDLDNDVQEELRVRGQGNLGYDEI